ALGDIDMEPMTDAFLTAAVLAAVAPANGSVTRIRGIANQHVKECDRIAAMCDELAKFGVTCENHADGIDVHGVRISDLAPVSPSVHCYDDHRVAMSFSILSCAAPLGAEIRERRCVGKTWPQWWDVLARDLGAPTAGSDPEPLEAEHKETAVATKPSIVIIGMRGVGKSTLGQAAAEALGLEFVDMDAYLESKIGKTIPEIIKADGWPAFRDHERAMLVQALEQEHPEGAVIACGGGVVESEQNRAYLKQYAKTGGTVVCLTPNMKHVAEYLEQDKTRPAYAITSDIYEVYQKRRPLYAECCNYEFLVDKSLVANAWPVIERDFVRLLNFATARSLNRVDLNSPSFFVSLTADDVRAYLPDTLGDVTAGSQAIEMRADLLLNNQQFAAADLDQPDVQEAFVEYVQSQFTLLRHSSGLPVVFTVRTEPQGGRFPGSADALRSRLLHLAVRWGAEYVDVEIDNIVAAKVFAGKQNSLVISSYHDTAGTRLTWTDCEFTNEILARGRACGDIVKLISVANAWEDNLKCLQFTQRHHSAAAPLIALNMGYAGQMSRVLCPCLTPVTHPALTTAAAPGQISVQEISQARSLMGKLPARSFYLFGTPIQHSPSPAMHNAGFAALGLPHMYRLNETSSADPLKAVIAAADFGGASVTIPYKQEIIPMLDELTDAAQTIGAVNTVIPDIRNGKRVLVGDNTDYLGICGCLERARATAGTQKFTSATALVIGAGGTSRAALYALYTLGVRNVALFNRTASRAHQLAGEFSGLLNVSVVGQLLDAAELKPTYIIGTIPGCDLVIPEQLFGENGVALDMAYKPRWTPLLETAQRNKWNVVHGVEVLVEQGVHQLAKWTKLSPPVRIMREAVYSKYDAEF
ncbi:3-dehydroquinate dehydratase (3-dehydroquinase), partial [Linderina pennispora]